MFNKDSKVEISVGCVQFLEEEVTRLRRENELIGTENRVINNFFALIDRVGAKPSQGYGEDKFWQARKEIEEAMAKKQNEDSKV